MADEKGTGEGSGRKGLNLRSNQSLVIGVLAGLLAIYLMHNYVGQQTKALGPTVEVLVAAKDIPRGVAVDKTMLKKQRMLQKYMTGDVILSSDVEEAVGNHAGINIPRNAPILWNYFTRAEVAEGLAATLKENQRALTLSIGGDGAVGGYVRPGDHIDILATFAVPEKYAYRGAIKAGAAPSAAGAQSAFPQLTKTLMQDVTVLATGQEITDVAQGAMGGRGATVSEFKNMTVLVSPVDAEILVFAQQNAALYACLRNKDVDKNILEQLPAVRFDNLIEIQEIQTTKAKQGERFKPFTSIQGQ